MTMTIATLLARVVLLALFLTTTTVALSAPLRSKAQEFFQGFKAERVVLSTVQGKLFGDNRNFTVVKVRSRGGISIEIFEKVADGRLQQVEIISLAKARDGFLNLRGDAMNLLLKDVDGNQTLEIIAPTFDDQMAPQLQVFAYNKDAKQYQSTF